VGESTGKEVRMGNHVEERFERIERNLEETGRNLKELGERVDEFHEKFTKDMEFVREILQESATQSRQNQMDIQAMLTAQRVKEIV